MPLLMVAGLLALVLGLFVAVPLAWLSVYTSYHDIFIARD
jgi:hypothetical protein